MAGLTKSTCFTLVSGKGADGGNFISSLATARGKRPIQVVVLSAAIGRLEDMRAFLFGKDVEADLLEFPATRPLDGSIRVRPTVRTAAMLLEGLMKKRRSGSCWCLQILEIGIDIGDIDAVVLFGASRWWRLCCSASGEDAAGRKRRT